MKRVLVCAALLWACGDDAPADPPDTGVDAEVDAAVPELEPADVPSPVVFPETIGTLSITVRTATEDGSQTADPVELCLRADRCFPLDARHIDDFGAGQIDVYHVPEVDLARSEIDQVTLRGPVGDPWLPACLELRFDGEPVYCNETLAVVGPEPWTDTGAEGELLQQDCTTCQRSKLAFGPMQGTHSPTTARIWVRTDATRDVALRMSKTDRIEDGPIVAWAQPRPGDDFTATLEVEGLASDHTYLYRIEVEEVSSPTHMLTTAPSAESAAPVRLAFGSCSGFAEQPIFATIRDAAPDAFLFVGDTHYGDAAYIEAHRWRLREFRGLPERADLFARVPIMATWDDHDFIGNNSDSTCLGTDDALQSWSEYWANPSAGTAETRGVFFQHRHGPLDLFVLDCRTHRPFTDDPLRICIDDPDAISPPIEDGMLGPDQERWLLERLEASDAPFKMLACGSQWTAEGTWDSWASFLPARDALFDAIDARGIDGVFLASGDIHRSALRRIDRPRYDLYEFTSSALAFTITPCRDASEQLHCYSDSHSFIVIDVDGRPDDPTLHVEIRSLDGSTPYSLDLRRSDLEG